MKDYGKTDRKRIRDLEQRVRRTVGTTSTVVVGGNSLSNADPYPVGPVDPGVSTDVSRADHTHSLTSAMYVIFDGGGSALATPLTCDLYVPFACQIVSVTLLADQAGDVEIDIMTDAYGSYPPTGADSIVAATPPTLSGAAKSQDSTLTGWDKDIAAGNTLRFDVTSVATIERLTLTLEVQRA